MESTQEHDALDVSADPDFAGFSELVESKSGAIVRALDLLADHGLSGIVTVATVLSLGWVGHAAPEATSWHGAFAVMGCMIVIGAFGYWSVRLIESKNHVQNREESTDDAAQSRNEPAGPHTPRKIEGPDLRRQFDRSHSERPGGV